MDIKKSLLVFLRLCVSSDYRLVRNLHIFDAGYYQQLLADTDSYDSLDPLWGYLKIKGTDYIWPDSSLGWTQLPDPHPLFDSSFYLLRYFPSGLAENPFVHYLRKGWKQGLQPSPYFDPVFYCDRSDWQEDAGDPLTHYTHYGGPKGISPGPYFDVSWYLDKNRTIDMRMPAPVKHYKLHGAKNGRSPVPLFDPAYYLAQLETKEQARQDPLSHYIAMADKSGTRPAEWLDPDYYCDRCAAGVKRSSALGHYLSEGVFQQTYTDVRVEQLPEKPLISIVVQIDNPDIRSLNNCIRSVVYQAYPHWELCLADDCSSDREGRAVVKQWAEKDSRIKVVLLDEKLGASGAINAAVTLAEGNYLGFLDSNDEMTPDCLFHAAEAIYHRKADLVYSDQDRYNEDGSRVSTSRKPDYNTELLLSHNYISHLVVVSKMLLERVGGFASQHDGAQFYDLLLKLTEISDRIYHIPKILYHRPVQSITAGLDHRRREYAHEAGKRALADTMKRRNYAAEVADAELHGFYRLNYSVPQIIRVSVIVWSELFTARSVARLANAIQNSSYRNAHLVLVSDNRDVAGWLDDHPVNPDSGIPVDHYCVDPGTSKARAIHLAAVSTEGDCIAFFDSSITDLENDCLEELLGPFGLDNVGVVCGRPLYGGSGGKSFTLPDVHDDASAYYQTFLQGSSRHLNGIHCLQQVSFCGWEATMIDRELYMEVGGLDWETFPVSMAMADLSLKIIGRGLKIVYTPAARVYKNCSMQDQKNSPKNTSRFSAEEKVLFTEKWRKELRNMDRFYNLGVLDDNSIDRELFERWFAGRTGEQ